MVRAALLALTDPEFNLNGVQATTHMAAPLVVVNGPAARSVGMNGGANAFGPGNRANATIGRAIRLVLLNVGGAHPPDLDKCTLGNPAKYSYAVCENEAESPFAPYHVERGFRPEDSTVFAVAAEAPHSVTDHQCNDPEGILDTMCSAMSTIASNNAVLSGHCVAVLGLEHARTIAGHGWTRSDVRHYLWMHSGNRFEAISRGHRYGPRLQPQPAALVQAGAGQPHPRGAGAGEHPPLRHGRRGRALLRLHPRLGAHEHAGAARGRRSEPAATTAMDCAGGTCAI